MFKLYSHRNWRSLHYRHHWTREGPYHLQTGIFAYLKCLSTPAKKGWGPSPLTMPSENRLYKATPFSSLLSFFPSPSIFPFFLTSKIACTSVTWLTTSWVTLNKPLMVPFKVWISSDKKFKVWSQPSVLPILQQSMYIYHKNFAIPAPGETLERISSIWANQDPGSRSDFPQSHGNTVAELRSERGFPSANRDLIFQYYVLDLILTATKFRLSLKVLISTVFIIQIEKKASFFSSCSARTEITSLVVLSDLMWLHLNIHCTSHCLLDWNDL